MKIKSKHKISIAAGALMLGLGSMASAQSTMVAGWDFSQFTNGFSTLDNANLQTFAQANYTSFPLPDGGEGFPVDQKAGPAWGDGETFGAVEFGRIRYDGTNGSTAVALGDKVLGFNGGADMTARNQNGQLGATGNFGVLDGQGQPNTNAQGMRFRDETGSGVDGTSFVIAIDLTEPNAAFDAGSNWQVDFAGKMESSGETGSINWEYSLDGSAYSGLQTTNLSSSEAGFTVDFSDAADLNGASQVFFRGTVQGIDDGPAGLAIDNVSVSASPADVSTGGSLFILDNPASLMQVANWYSTPMGIIFTGSGSQWIWSNEFGWHFSPESNTGDEAFVFIKDAPFQTWVFVDQSSATEDGFWGFAFDASDAAVSGWFFFFNPTSTDNVGSYVLWDEEGEEVLTFSDKSAR